MRFSALAMISGSILLPLCARPAAAQRNEATASAGTAIATPMQKTENVSDAAHPELHHRDGRYQLCASDVITLTFPLTPEFNQTATVQPDGFISLVGAGDVHLEGLTAEESIQPIKAAYAKILHDPTSMKRFLIALTVTGEGKTPEGAIGTGAFQVSGFANGVLTLATNDGCWQGRPLLDSIEIRTHKPVRDQWLDLSVGRADLVEVPAEQLRQAQQQRLTVVTAPALSLLALQVADYGALANPMLRPNPGPYPGAGEILSRKILSA